MKNLLISLAILFACLSARAVTVTFASPPFDKNAFIVDQPHNFIGLIGAETNDPFGTTVNIGYTNIQGTNYFYLYGTITNNTAGASASATNSPNGTSLNSIPLTAFYIPGTTAYFSNQSLYVGTNNFSGGGGAGGITALTKDVTASGTGSVAATVVGINGTLMSGLATGILKNTTGTGVPSIAVAADFPTLNQNTTGNAQTATFATSAGTATTAITASTANALKSATTSVSVSTATAPVFGEALVGTSTTTAIWMPIFTNTVYTNTGPDTYVIGLTEYLNTNTFGGSGGGSGITQLTGDVLAGPGSGSVASTLVNIPTSTIMAGSLLDTAISAPSTPASGKGQIYEDATSKNLAIKNDAGTINHGIQTRTTTASQWIRSIADDGSSTISQPAFTDISGSVAAGQMPALTGDATTVAGSVAVTVKGINGTILSGLQSGILFNTLGTGVPTTRNDWPSIASVTTGLLPTTALGTGTPGPTTFLAGDQIYKTIASGGGFSNQLSTAVNHLAFNFGVNINTGNGGGMAVGDMNTDGIPDIVVDINTATVVYTNSRTGVSFPQASTFAQTSVAAGVSLADVNGDGRLDAIASSRTGNYINVLTNVGNGTLVQLGGNYTFGSGANFITTIPGIIDFNSSQDFLAFNGAITSVYTNDGIGNFAVSTNLPVFVGASTDEAMGDLNTDGTNDLVFAPSVAITSGIFGIVTMTNNGLGVFQYWTTNAMNSTSGPFALLVADFNGDGKMDIAAAVTPGNPAIIVFTNNGNGFGQYSSNLFAFTSSGAKLVASDLNQDGKMDILATSLNAFDTVAYTNAGFGRGFVPAYTNISVTGANPLYTAAADFNGDGWPDFAVYNIASSFGVNVFINTPNIAGNFYGNGAAITNLNIPVVFSSSAVTPANSFQTNSLANGGTLNLNTNYPNRTAANDLLTQKLDGSGLTNIAAVAGVLHTNYFAKSAAQTFSTFTTPASITNMYQVGGWIGVTAILTDVIALQCAYTDNRNNSRTLNLLSGVGATGMNNANTVTICCAPASTIIFTLALTTGTGTVTYDCGGFIQGVY